MTKLYENGSNERYTVVSFIRKQQINYRFNIKSVVAENHATLSKKRLQQRCIPLNFAKFLLFKTSVHVFFLTHATHAKISNHAT